MGRERARARERERDRESEREMETLLGVPRVGATPAQGSGWEGGGG